MLSVHEYIFLLVSSVRLFMHEVKLNIRVLFNFFSNLAHNNLDDFPDISQNSALEEL